VKLDESSRHRVGNPATNLSIFAEKTLESG